MPGVRFDWIDGVKLSQGAISSFRPDILCQIRTGFQVKGIECKSVVIARGLLSCLVAVVSVVNIS